MTTWFLTFHEDPVNETPRADGEYHFIWGGPYDANDVLQDEFSDIIDFERIQEAVREVQENGVIEWAPTSRHPDYLVSMDDAEQSDTGDIPVEDTLAELLRRLQRGDEFRFGTEEERANRDAILRRMDRLEAAVQELRSRPPGIGHNGAPEEEDDGEERRAEIASVGDAIAAVGEMRTELDKLQPDAVVVVAAAGRLARFGRWMQERAIKAAEKGVENAMIGVVIATASAGVVLAEPAVVPLIADVTQAVARWAQAAMALF